jgi:transposase
MRSVHHDGMKNKPGKTPFKSVAVRLKDHERSELEVMLKKGPQSARVLRRAQMLLWLDQGKRCSEIASLLPKTSETTPRNIAHRYLAEGLERALYEAPRPGAERALTERQSQQIVAQVCGPPPEGRDRWTVRLIAEEAKLRGIVDTIGRESIRILLKSHDLKPWLKKNVVRTGADGGVRGKDGGRPQYLRKAS